MKTRLVLFAVALATFHTSAASAALTGIIISNDATQNMTCSAGICDPTDVHAVLNVTELENLLATSDVTVNSRFLRDKHHFKYLRQIDIATPLSWNTASKLILGTPGFYSLVKIDAPTSVLGGGGLILSGIPTFATDISVTFASTDSIFSIVGQTYTLVSDFPSLATNMAANPEGLFALASDYDAVNDQFANPPIETFSGYLLGLGHTISNLTIPKGRKLCEGMISSNAGSISHLNLSNVSVNPDKRSQYVGGITGCNRGAIYDVVVSGLIAGRSDSDTGGIAGISHASIVAASSSATITGGQAGGLVGENDGGIAYAFASGPVNGVINSGGLVGNNSKSIELSYATGNVTGSKNNTGGFVGSNRGQVRNSYALGSVSGSSGAAGGFVGYNVGSVQYAYSIGATSGNKKYTGGFAGYDANEAIDNAYWDTDTSGFSSRRDGAGFPDYDPGITGLTTAKLKSGVPSGFGKHSWAQDPNINNGYPYLRANPPQ